ncbi:MAG: hypothetical protein M3282_02910, partial [Gemmatimonadota bacterium]|nr:hypothetical protein [Gemmatimonadota bacterium]
RDSWDYGYSGYSAVVTVGSEAPPPPPPPPSGSPAVLIVLDRDAIDNGTAPNSFTAADVNDDIAAVGQRRQLRLFAANVGRALTLHSGTVGNEGFFALRSVPTSWASAGPTTDGLQNYVQSGPGLGAPDRTTGWKESLLDRVSDAVPLRATGLKLLVGRSVCAIVMDEDSWPRTFQPPVLNLKGPNLGIVAFQVTSVTRFTGGTASSLPNVAMTVLDATQVCGGQLAPLPDAPVLTSWSSPADVVP